MANTDGTLSVTLEATVVGENTTYKLVNIEGKDAFIGITNKDKNNLVYSGENPIGSVIETGKFDASVVQGGKRNRRRMSGTAVRRSTVRGRRQRNRRRSRVSRA